MKLFLILSILTILGLVKVEAYEYGKSYHYLYHGHIYTGFSELKPQRSGVSFSSKVILHRSHDYYVFELQSFVFERYNSEFEDTKSSFQSFLSSEKLLRDPFRVYFNGGRVQYFETSPNEDVWSLNIKKGLLALFNLNLEKDYHFYSKDRRHFSSDYIRPRYENHNYKVYEDGVGGECETFYTIQSQVYHETPYENNVLNITKVKNYHKCKRDPVRSYVTHKGYQCVECESSQSHPFHANSRYYYNIRGNRHNYVIERIISNGEFMYSPYTTQTINARLNRHLELINEREDSPIDTTSFYKNVIKHTSLAYEYEDTKSTYETFDLKNAHYLYDIYGYHVSTEEVKKLLREIIEHHDFHGSSEEYRSKNIPRKFIELVRALATLDYRRFEDVYKYVTDDFTDSKILQLFVNALTVTGTNPSFFMAKYLFENKKIQPEMISYYLTTAPFHFKQLTEILLQEFYELCEYPYIREHYQLHSTCHLAFAGLVHQTCVVGNTIDHSLKHKHCTPERAEKYFNYVIPHQRFERNIDEITYIKIAGNFGLRQTIEFVKPYVSKDHHHHHPLYFRVSALWALSRVTHYYPDEVLELLIPLYFDTSEDYEVRIAAFALVLMSKSSSYILETIADSLYHEPNDHVKSFVYSTFYYLANSTHPCHKKISEKASFFLHQLKALKYDFQLDLDHSFNFFTSGYEKEYDYGGLTHIAYIHSNSSYIPRAVYVRLNDYFGGESHNSIALGYQAYGLEKYFDQIFGPRGPFRESSFFENFGQRRPRDVNTVEKELKELYDKINIETREYEPTYGDFFIQHQGTQISFFHFNESFIKNILSLDNNSDQINKSDHLQIDKYLLGTDRTYLIPTDLGFPLVFSIMQPLYLHFNNNFDYETQKKGVFTTEIKARVDGHLIYDHELYSTLEVIIPYEEVTHGAGILRRSTVSLPININASLDFENSKITFKHTPINSHNIYHLEFEPFTFTNDYTDHSSNYIRDKIPLYEEEHMHHNEHNFTNQYLGIGARTKVAYNDIWNDYGSWYDFLTKTDFRQKFYYYFGNPHFHPYNFDFFVEKLPEDKVNELEAVIKYDYYGLGDKEDRPLESLMEKLEEFGRTGSDREWYTHVISGDLYSRGQYERHIKTELTYSYSKDKLLHKYHIFYDRTPLQPIEKDHFQICISGIFNFPKYNNIRSFYDLEIENLHRSVNTTLNIYFGADCKSDKKITIKGHFDRTEEQKNYEVRREEPVTHERFNEYAYYYQKCKEERQHGYYFNHYCIYYMHLMTELRQYNIEINYENLPEYFKNVTYKLASCFRHCYYNHVDRNIYAKNSDGQIRIEFNVSLHDNVADVRVYEPHETIHYSHIYVPQFYPIKVYQSYYYSNLKEYIRTYSPPFCSVQKDKVKTFDNVTYTLPPIDCYKILAKDCSPTQRFLVLGKKINHPRYEKAVKVFFDKYKVEALPVSDESDIIVRVNGKRVTVVENEPYYHYVTINERQSLLFVIAYNGFFYSFRSHVYGLSVSYNGKGIYIQLSPNQKGKQCGLCGDYNGDRQNEFRGPEGCIYHDVRNFGYSYAIPEENCDVPKRYSPCRVKSHDCFLKRNPYVEVKNKVCFSITPIITCEKGCEPKGSIRINAHFHCLNAADKSTNQLKIESKYRILEELSKKSKDYSVEIQYPESCIPSEH